MKSPNGLGYRMPAEWEKHRATWISWPKDPGTFPGEVLPRVEAAYSRMVQELSKGEEVRILVNDPYWEGRAQRALGRVENVVFHHVKTVDVWTRDYGPICVTDGKALAATKWRFNAWGGKYEDLLPDDGAGEKLAELSAPVVFRQETVLEGGSIDVDGKGTLLTTEQCLLNPNRNPRMSRLEIEALLKANLGASKTIWLKNGIEGDDTDGHVDDIARFVSGRRVVVAEERAEGDANRSPLDDAASIIENSTDHEGKDLELVRIPMPARVDAPDGRLPASHANFYIGNAAVIVPTFGGKSDRVVLDVLAREFPTRETVGVDCRALVHGLGTIHCVTQQVPAV